MLKLCAGISILLFWISTFIWGISYNIDQSDASDFRKMMNNTTLWYDDDRGIYSEFLCEDGGLRHFIDENDVYPIGDGSFTRQKDAISLVKSLDYEALSALIGSAGLGFTAAELLAADVSKGMHNFDHRKILYAFPPILGMVSGYMMGVYVADYLSMSCSRQGRAFEKVANEITKGRVAMLFDESEMMKDWPPSICNDGLPDEIFGFVHRDYEWRPISDFTFTLDKLNNIYNKHEDEILDKNDYEKIRKEICRNMPFSINNTKTIKKVL